MKQANVQGRTAGFMLLGHTATAVSVAASICSSDSNQDRQQAGVKALTVTQGGKAEADIAITVRINPDSLMPRQMQMV